MAATIPIQRSSAATSFDRLRLAEAMKEHGLTDSALAELVGVDRTSVLGWRNGHRNPTFSNAAAVAAALNKDLSYFTPEAAQQ